MGEERFSQISYNLKGLSWDVIHFYQRLVYHVSFSQGLLLSSPISMVTCVPYLSVDCLLPICPARWESLSFLSDPVVVS